MPIKQIRSKSRLPQSLQYNAWAPVQYARIASNTTPSIVSQPLGLNTKIIAVPYFLEVTGAGLQFLNFVSGASTTGLGGSGGRSSYGFVDLGSTFAAGDTIGFSIAGVVYSTTVNARNTGSNAKVAAGVVTSLSYNTAFNALYRANSLGGEIVIQTLAYATATPAFSVAVVTSASGTATANGANFVAGVAGTLPSQPVSDQTNNGIVPSGTAIVGNTLFPVDIILPGFTTANNKLTGVIYCYENFDAIWPAVSTLSLVVGNPTSGTFATTATLMSTPMDNHPMQPEEAASVFRLSANIL